MNEKNEEIEEILADDAFMKQLEAMDDVVSASLSDSDFACSRVQCSIYRVSDRLYHIHNNSGAFFLFRDIGEDVEDLGSFSSKELAQQAAEAHTAILKKCDPEFDRLAKLHQELWTKLESEYAAAIADYRLDKPRR